MSAWLARDFRDLALVLAVMLAVVVLLPRWMIPAETASQKVAAWGILKTAVIAYAAGGLVFFLLYARLNDGQAALLLQNPVERLSFFLGRSALLAMLWGPVLGFMWLRTAQEVERRRGEKLVRSKGATP